MCPSFPEIENPACLRPGLLGQDTRVVTSDAGYILTATLHFLQHADPHQISPLRLTGITTAGRQLAQKIRALLDPFAPRSLMGHQLVCRKAKGTEYHGWETAAERQLHGLQLVGKGGNLL